MQRNASQLFLPIYGNPSHKNRQSLLSGVTRNRLCSTVVRRRPVSTQTEFGAGLSASSGDRASVERFNTFAPIIHRYYIFWFWFFQVSYVCILSGCAYLLWSVSYLLWKISADNIFWYILYYIDFPTTYGQYLRQQRDSAESDGRLKNLSEHVKKLRSYLVRDS